MAAAQEQNQSPEGADQNLGNLPFVLVHRLPQFALFFEPWLRARFRLLDPLDPSFSADDARSARLLLCVGPIPLKSETLDRYPSIDCVVTSSAGIDHIDLGECRRRGIRVSNAGDAFSEDAADYAVGLLVNALRMVSASDRYIRAGSWHVKGEYPLGSKLGGKRVGIIGLGSIGSMIATRLEAFGCSIAYSSRKKKHNVSYTYYESVKELATNSNVLVTCCALTDQTRHIIDEEIMTLLGKDGVIVNVGRGALIDEKALVEFLVRGDLGGAGLDVYEDEPHVPRELYGLDNVVLSPHKAVSTPESFEALGEVVMANIESFFANKPLLSEVFYES